MKRHLASAAFTLLLSCLLMTSCMKKEQAITLPPPTGAQQGTVTMGETYEAQVFYDIEQNKVVASSAISSWDLAFEASPQGKHVFMNGGKGVFLYNTHNREFAAVKGFPAGFNASQLLFDDPSGRPDSTAVRDWTNAKGDSKREVFIAKLSDTALYKFVLISVDSSQYVLEYGRLQDSNPNIVKLPKNADYNFTYFSFANGIVTPEPPKASWDIVFTRYRYIYRDLDNFPYEVNGALLNPCSVLAAADSAHTFATITLEKASGMQLVASRDAIGADWKIYNFATSRYEVNKNKVYVVRTRNAQLHKLHFLNFYDQKGAKGTPSFETEQLQ